MAAASGRMAGSGFRVAFSALSFPAFRRVWSATLVSHAGNWMQITGRAALIYEATGSTAALGTVYFLSYIPQLFLSQLAGLVVDRYDRRRLLMTSQLLAALGAFAMGVVAVTDTASVLTVGAVSFAIGVVQAVMMPAQQALVPALVPREHLLSAISLNSATIGSSRIVGPLLAGLVNETLGIPWLFWLNAASFLVIIGAWVTVTVARPPRSTDAGIVDALLAGARLVRRTPALAVALATTFVICGIGNVYQALAVAFTTDVLAGGDVSTGTSYFTYFQAAMGAGAIGGILGLTDVAKRWPGRSVLVAATGLSLCLVLLGQVSTLTPVLAIGLVLGLSFYATNALTLNVIQHRTPEEVRGRVMAIHTLAFVGTFPISSVVAGWFADVFSVSAVLAGTGVLCLLYCVPLVRWSRHLTEGDGHRPGGDEIPDGDAVAAGHEAIG